MMHEPQEHKADLLPRPGRRGRPLRDGEGNRLLKRVVFRVFPAAGPAQTVQKIAPPGRGFSEADIDALLDDFASLLDVTFPRHDFRMAEVGGGQFNFICCGERALPIRETRPEHETLVEIGERTSPLPQLS